MNNYLKFNLKIILIFIFLILGFVQNSVAFSQADLITTELYKKFKLNKNDYKDWKDDVVSMSNFLKIHPFFILENQILNNPRSLVIFEEFNCNIKSKTNLKCKNGGQIKIKNSYIKEVKLPITDKEMIDAYSYNSVYEDMFVQISNLRANNKNINYKSIKNKIFVIMSFKDNLSSNLKENENKKLSGKNSFLKNNQFFKKFTDEPYNGKILFEERTDYLVLKNSINDYGLNFKNYLNIEKKITQNFINGFPHGAFLSFPYDSDIPIIKGNFKYGFEHGKFSHFYPSGQLSYEENFKFGKHHGKWVSYHNNGTIRKKMLFKNGKFDGEIVSYFSNGNIREQKFYNNNIEENTWKFFDENKNLKRIQVWESGKLISEKKY